MSILPDHSKVAEIAGSVVIPRFALRVEKDQTMRHLLCRRSFLKTTGLGAAGLVLGFQGTGCARGDETSPEPAIEGVPPSATSVSSDGRVRAEQLGWRLGCQAYTFRSFSFFEAVEKTAASGMGYIEAYPGQTLGKGASGTRMDVGLGPAERQEIKARLDAAGVKLVNFGVCRLVKDEDDSRKTFDFAKEMGIETLVAEPPEDAFDTLDKLCNEYQINLAIHNHAKPTHYWDYRTVLAVCKGRSPRIGACGDTGHWMRSGIQPLEALKALEGRMVSLHLKDLNEFGKQSAYDVPWGTGKANVRELLEELRRQKFQGVFSVEYEHNTPELMENVGRCARYFDGVVSELALRR